MNSLETSGRSVRRHLFVGMLIGTCATWFAACSSSSWTPNTGTGGTVFGTGGAKATGGVNGTGGANQTGAGGVGGMAGMGGFGGLAGGAPVGTGGQTTCDAGSPDAAVDAGGADLPMCTSAPENPIHSGWYPSNFPSAGNLDAGADAGSGSGCHLSVDSTHVVCAGPAWLSATGSIGGAGGNNASGPGGAGDSRHTDRVERRPSCGLAVAEHEKTYGSNGERAYLRSGVF